MGSRAKLCPKRLTMQQRITSWCQLFTSMMISHDCTAKLAQLCSARFLRLQAPQLQLCRMTRHVRPQAPDGQLGVGVPVWQRAQRRAPAGTRTLKSRFVHRIWTLSTPHNRL